RPRSPADVRRREHDPRTSAGERGRPRVFALIPTRPHSRERPGMFHCFLDFGIATTVHGLRPVTGRPCYLPRGIPETHLIGRATPRGTGSVPAGQCGLASGGSSTATGPARSKDVRLETACAPVVESD